MKYCIKSTQSGRSMVEIMGYMVVSMFLVAGISKVVSGAYSEYKISQGSLQIADFAGTIAKASAADANYLEIVKVINGTFSSDTETAKLQKAERLRLIPKSYRLVDNTIYNTFGGEVRVSVPSDENNPVKDELGSDHPGDQFAIQFLGLDRDQCIALMTKDWMNNRVVDLYAIVLSSGGTNTYWYWPIYQPSATGDKTLPVKMADVAGTGSGTNSNGLCGDENNIMWVFN